MCGEIDESNVVDVVVVSKQHVDEIRAVRVRRLRCWNKLGVRGRRWIDVGWGVR